MAYPDHYLLSFGGPLRTEEIWSMNIRFISSNVLTSGDQEAFLAPAKTAIQAWGTSISGGWSNAAKLSYVKFNRIDGAGHYQDTTDTHRLDFAPVAMKATSSVFPNQVALVLTWLTDFSRGPAHMGRVYLPVPAVDIDSTTGRWSASQCLNTANAAAAFLNDINVSGLVGTPFEDIEASVVSAIDETKARITSVRMGDVPDTQRRRRNALPEVYTTGTTLVTDV